MKILLLITLVCCCGLTFGQSVGDIAFVGYNTDGEKAFSIVVLETIDGSSGDIDLYFTDDDWNGTALAGGEGTITWTVSTLIVAGTVVDFTDVSSSVAVSVGSASESNAFSPINGSDAVYAYVGSLGSPSTFLAAITNDDFTNDSFLLTGTGLTVGVEAIELDAIDTDADIAEYVGTRIGDQSSLLTAINSTANWITQDASGDQSIDGTEPDVPFNNNSFIVSSGNSITWDGSESSSWVNGDNWGGGVLPTSSDNIIIANAGTAPIIAAGTEASCFNLTIDASASLTISSGGSFAIFGTAINNGTYTVQKAVTGSAGYSILGAPISDATIDDMSLADYIVGYDNSDDSWPVPNGTDAMNEGVGLFVGYDESSPTVSFSGTPNAGDVTYTVTQTSGFELVANPYAAAITVADFLSDNTIISGGVYLWDDGGANDGGDRVGDYIAVTSVGAASAVDPTGQTNGFYGDTAPADDGYIASVQGFFVEVVNSGTITFSADHQTSADGSNDESDHYRSEENVDYQKVKLAITGNSLYNEVLIGLGKNATLGIDRALDAKKFVSGSPLSFYSFIDDEKYVIQALPLLASEDMVVPLGFNAKAGTLSMKVIDFENISENMKVTLVDNMTGISYNLRNIESFEFSTEVVENDRRFELVFNPAEVLSVGNLTKGIMVFGGTSELTIQSQLKGLHDVSIYSLNGTVAFREAVKFSNNEVKINPSLTQNKVYIMKLDDESFKFVIK